MYSLCLDVTVTRAAGQACVAGATLGGAPQEASLTGPAAPQQTGSALSAVGGGITKCRNVLRESNPKC